MPVSALRRSDSEGVLGYALVCAESLVGVKECGERADDPNKRLPDGWSRQ